MNPLGNTEGGDRFFVAIHRAKLCFLKISFAMFPDQPKEFSVDKRRSFKIEVCLFYLGLEFNFSAVYAN